MHAREQGDVRNMYTKQASRCFTSTENASFSAHQMSPSQIVPSGVVMVHRNRQSAGEDRGRAGIQSFLTCGSHCISEDGLDPEDCELVEELG